MKRSVGCNIAHVLSFSSNKSLGERRVTKCKSITSSRGSWYLARYPDIKECDPLRRSRTKARQGPYSTDYNTLTWSEKWTRYWSLFLLTSRSGMSWRTTRVTCIGIHQCTIKSWRSNGRHGSERRSRVTTMLRRILRCWRCTGYYSIVITMPKKERCSRVTNIVGKLARRILVVTPMVPTQNLKQG